MATLPPAYGSDQTGLVYGYQFRHGHAPAAVNAEQAAAWLRGGEQEEGVFVWLHFNLANTASEKWLKEHAGLAEEFHESLHEGPRSTRIEVADNALIAVINDVVHDFSFDPSDIATLWLSVGSRSVISARRQQLQAIDSLRRAVQSGEELNSPVDLLAHLLRDQADAMVKIVRDATGKVDHIEDHLLAGKLKHKRANLGALRRVLVRLRRLLAPEPAALFRLLQKPPAWIADAAAEELRQASEEFAVVLNDMSALQERIKLLQEEIAAQVNESNNQSLYVLTIVTVLALPINIIAGLLGMNVGGIPLANESHGFWVVVGIVAAFTVIAGWLAFRRQGDDGP